MQWKCFGLLCLVSNLSPLFANGDGQKECSSSSFKTSNPIGQPNLKEIQDANADFDDFLKEVGADKIVNDNNFTRVRPKISKSSEVSDLRSKGAKGLIELYSQVTGIIERPLKEKDFRLRSLSLQVYIRLRLHFGLFQSYDSVPSIESISELRYNRLIISTNEPISEIRLTLELLGSQKGAPWITNNMAQTVASQLRHPEPWIQYSALFAIRNLLGRRGISPRIIMKRVLRTSLSDNPFVRFRSLSLLNHLALRYGLIPKPLINTLFYGLFDPERANRHVSLSAITSIIDADPNSESSFGAIISSKLKANDFSPLTKIQLLTLLAPIHSFENLNELGDGIASSGLASRNRLFREASIRYFEAKVGGIPESNYEILDKILNLPVYVDEELGIKNDQAYRVATLTGLNLIENTDLITDEILERLSQKKWVHSTIRIRWMIVDLMLKLNPNRKIRKIVIDNFKEACKGHQRNVAKEVNKILQFFEENNMDGSNP